MSSNGLPYRPSLRNMPRRSMTKVSGRRQMRPYPLPLASTVHANRDDFQAFSAMQPVVRVQCRHLLAARRAPRRPEIDHDDIAGLIGERKCGAIEQPGFEGRRAFAHRKRSRARGERRQAQDEEGREGVHGIRLRGRSDSLSRATPNRTTGLLRRCGLFQELLGGRCPQPHGRLRHFLRHVGVLLGQRGHRRAAEAITSARRSAIVGTGTWRDSATFSASCIRVARAPVVSSPCSVIACTICCRTNIRCQSLRKVAHRPAEKGENCCEM